MPYIVYNIDIAFDINIVFDIDYHSTVVPHSFVGSVVTAERTQNKNRQNCSRSSRFHSLMLGHHRVAQQKRQLNVPPFIEWRHVQMPFLLASLFCEADTLATLI